MQMCRPNNECFEQSHNQQSCLKGTKPTVCGGSNVGHRQTQTHCITAKHPGAHAGYGHGTQHADGALAHCPKKLPNQQHAQHGSHGQVQNGGTKTNGAIHKSSYATKHASPHATMGLHNGSQAAGHQQAVSHGCVNPKLSGCEAKSGAKSYRMKKKEKKSCKKSSDNDSDGSSSSSDSSDSD